MLFESAIDKNKDRRCPLSPRAGSVHETAETAYELNARCLSPFSAGQPGWSGSTS